VLYHLSYISNPFGFHYFSSRIFSFCLGPASDQDSPIYGLPCSCNLGQASQCPVYLLRGDPPNFLSKLVLNHDPLNLSE
jgi:hypothetical protein